MSEVADKELPIVPCVIAALVGFGLGVGAVILVNSFVSRARIVDLDARTSAETKFLRQRYAALQKHSGELEQQLVLAQDGNAMLTELARLKSANADLEQRLEQLAEIE